jgi:two-component system chemotaxis response regulator CheB
VNNASPSATQPVDVIGIGASAGGLQPLRAIVAALPEDFAASVLVVVHVAATGTSVLPQILGRATDLEVLPAQDDLELRPGRVVVATPDRHLTVEDGRVRTSRGPRENGHRPSIDPLLRTLAAGYGPRAAGVILSGARDDGTQGLAEIKRQGGVALVQDPAEAEYPGMPASALAAAPVDGVLAAADIAAALFDLANGRGPRLTLAEPPSPLAVGGDPFRITCPDCGGVLTETDDAGVVHFRCHVGHAYSPRSLLALHAEGVEHALWTAARSLEDRAALLRRLATRTRSAGNVRSADQFERNANAAHSEADAIRVAIAALDDGFTADVDVGDTEEVVE